MKASLKPSDLLMKCIGKTIKRARIIEDSNKLEIVFEENTILYVWDAGQSCCEDRYMRTDDDLTEFDRAKFIGLEVRPAETLRDESLDVHECAFLAVHTTHGDMVFSNHVEHNGYHGGFALEAEVVELSSTKYSLEVSNG